MRLLYLDEAGSDHRAPFLCVAGVLVHGDREWPEVDRLMRELIDRWIAPEDRLGFIFHATDIYHGCEYFDRRKPEWADEAKRIRLLDEIAGIIKELSLPVVWGHYEKSSFGVNILPADMSNNERARIIQSTAVMDCLIRTDTWLETFAPDELATVIHEDGTPAKPLIKKLVWVARNREILKASELRAFASTPGLPLKRIIDTVHFADKADARPLQLADLCAFIIGRGLKQKPVPEIATKIIFHQLTSWVSKASKDPDFAKKIAESANPLLS